MVSDKVKDAVTILLNQREKGIAKGIHYGRRISVTYLYNEVRGRGGHTHPLDVTALPGIFCGMGIGEPAGLAGGLRDIVTRKFMSHQQIQVLQNKLIDLKNNLGRYGEKAVNELIETITKEYERSKTLVNSQSSCILSQELQKPTINLEKKIDKMIAYIVPESIPGRREPYRNNGKRLFHIISKELDAFNKKIKRIQRAALVTTYALNKGKAPVPDKPTHVGQDLTNIIAKYIKL